MVSLGGSDGSVWLLLFVIRNTFINILGKLSSIAKVMVICFLLLQEYAELAMRLPNQAQTCSTN